VRDLVKGTLKFAGVIAAILAAIAVVLRLTVVDVAVVGHNAMAPTMEAGEQVLIWHGTEFDRGTIAVCAHPENPGEMVMGRVVGLPGETVSSERGSFRVNNRARDTDWRGDVRFTDTLNNRTDTVKLGIESMGNHEHGIFHRGTQEFSIRDYEVEEGRLYLLGDNRFHRGNDSRDFGTVLAADCLGYVFMRLKPAEIPVNDLGHSYMDLLR